MTERRKQDLSKRLDLRRDGLDRHHFVLRQSKRQGTDSGRFGRAPLRPHGAPRV